ncbi:MAG TPA: class I SAM-dependent methyltransferase [Bryobacteraceae bacterium]|nr:class I SAM-dependent methyltransferase [Bryobacteraceae bacterium]
MLTHDVPDPVFRSFRDPAGNLIRHRGRILRTVRPEAVPDLEAFLSTPVARNAMDQGKIVPSVRIPSSAVPNVSEFSGANYVVEHEPIPFPSYPFEWPAEMLFSAGALTIELAQAVLDEGFGLKDATPYNVLFRGSQPVFVDILSFEQRHPLDRSWMAYAQFTQTFVLPLMANRHFGLSMASLFTGSREGIDPETMYRLAGPIRRLKPGFLSLVSLPKWLEGKADDASFYSPKPASSPDQANFIVKGLLRSCEKRIAATKPAHADSRWSQYLDQKSLYTPAQLARKEAFVSEAMAIAGPKTVLDVGANEGHFSFLAARQGASVVAIDSDPVVAGAIWRRASTGRLDVLPLVVDLTRPTPAIGWRNQECLSFLDRATGHFDMLMMLAVLHHMLVTERIPLEDSLALAADLTRDYALIEFVAPEDPMFQRIVRGRQKLYSHLTQTRFEAAAAPHFELVRSLRIDGLHRWLYLFRRRHAAS